MRTRHAAGKKAKCKEYVHPVEKPSPQAWFDRKVKVCLVLLVTSALLHFFIPSFLSSRTQASACMKLVESLQVMPDAYAFVRVVDDAITGRGLVAARSLERGDVVLRVPMHLTLAALPVTSQLQAAAEAVNCTIVHCADYILFGGRLLVEWRKGRRSAMADYFGCIGDQVLQLHALPVRVQDAVTNFTQVQSPTTIIEAMRQAFDAARLFQPPATLWELQFALSVVQTRAFEDRGVVPVGDLFNHHFNETATTVMRAAPQQEPHKNGMQTHFTWVASRRLEPSEPLVFQYKVSSNLELLVKYGFRQRGNMLGPKFSFNLSNGAFTSTNPAEHYALLKRVCEKADTIKLERHGPILKVNLRLRMPPRNPIHERAWQCIRLLGLQQELPLRELERPPGGRQEIERWEKSDASLVKMVSSLCLEWRRDSQELVTRLNSTSANIADLKSKDFLALLLDEVQLSREVFAQCTAQVSKRDFAPD